MNSGTEIKNANNYALIMKRPTTLLIHAILNMVLLLFILNPNAFKSSTIYEITNVNSLPITFPLILLILNTLINPIFIEKKTV